MYCVLRTNHAKFAKETSTLKSAHFFWNRVYIEIISAIELGNRPLPL